MARKWERQKKLIAELVNFFLEKGTRPYDVDNNGYIPAMYGLETKVDCLNRKNYFAVKKVM